MAERDSREEPDGEDFHPRVGRVGRAQCKQGVFCKHDAVTGCEAEQNGLNGDEGGREESRSGKRILDVHLDGDKSQCLRRSWPATPPSPALALSPPE